MSWVKMLIFSNVVLDGSKSNVISIGGMPCNSIPVPVIAIFLYQEDVQVINKKEKGGHVGFDFATFTRI